MLRSTILLPIDTDIVLTSCSNISSAIAVKIWSYRACDDLIELLQEVIQIHPNSGKEHK